MPRLRQSACGLTAMAWSQATWDASHWNGHNERLQQSYYSGLEMD